MYLLQNQTTNTDGNQPAIQLSGGPITVMAEGAFDGASMTLELTMHGMTYRPLRDASGDVITITAADQTPIVVNNLKSGMTIRAAITDAGASTNISAAFL